MPTALTAGLLQQEAIAFARAELKWAEPSLFGVTDGKAIGTYLEHKFQAHLQSRYDYSRGSSAKGIDSPELDVDIKVTSIRQAAIVLPIQERPPENLRSRLFTARFRLRQEG